MANFKEIRGIVQSELTLRGEVQKSDGSIYVAVISKTKAEWAQVPQMMSVNKVLYVYSDYRQEEDSVTHETINIPRIKIGDGVSYVADLPFVTMSITEEDIARWDEGGIKVRVDDEANSLVFYE